MAAPNTVSELQDLRLMHPAPDAPVATVAAWYERKAEVLAHLAAEGSRKAAGHAEVARRHAAALLAGMPGQGNGAPVLVGSGRR
ncbi:hypothetical protein [Qaidamihabitans albus]|uniref:hypothetical protein n=1 Tax=Qaidamihabitans albus TaxID=2795733 RepID=UPI0018F25426|nr:hypothetical protein [Qaidamihabitans albus]